jgi:septal ring factor EnvC (AmiA/AmiB activator)
MKKRIMVCGVLSVLVVSCLLARVQAKTQPRLHSAQEQANQSTPADAKEKNIQEYIELMRSNVRDEKSQIMGAVMQLNIDDAAKFWPIYSQYDAELTKLNNLRVENVQDYANNYSQMTDAKADELIQRSLDYQKQRGELLAKYYQVMKQSVGAINAARFLQVEHQLLLIIDLQIASSLPIAQE